MFGERKGQDLRVKTTEETLDSVTSHGAGALARPFIIPLEGYHQGGERSHNPPRSPDDPLGTITQRGYGGVAAAFLTEYYGNGGVSSTEEPVPTITTKNRFGLVQPVVDGLVLDIEYRMLLAEELSAAMGFPSDYKWKGTKTETVKMIGNAVSVDIARALCTSLLTKPEGRLA